MGRGWNWFRIVPDRVFGIGNAERLGPATKEHADKQADMINLSEIGYEGRRCMELAEDCVQWQASGSATKVS